MAHRTLLLLAMLLAPAAAHAEAATAEELAGRWAKVSRLESITEVAVLGDLKQKTEVVSLVDIKVGPNGQMSYRERTCRLSTKTLGGMIRTTYPVKFLKMLARDWSPLEVVEDGDELTLVQQKAPRDYGEGGSDQDGDGHPGVTIEVSGLVGGEIYASVREWSTSLGRVNGPNEIEGRVEWDARLKVFDATSKRLRSQPKTRRKPDPEAHTFVMRRVRENANCGRLLDQLDDVF